MQKNDNDGNTQNTVELFDLKRTFSDSVVIAGITLVGYALAFFYEWGYAKYFGIPPELISINFTNIFLAVAGVIILILIFFILGDLIHSLTQGAPAVIRRCLSRLSLGFFLVIGLLFLYKGEWKEWIAGFIAFLLYSILEFVFPLLTQRHVKGYVAKLESQEEIEPPPLTLILKIRQRLGYSGFMCILWCCLIIFLALYAGDAKARNKTVYIVADQSMTQAVVAIYGDLIISCTFDPQTKLLNGELSISQLTDGKERSFIPEQIGPLKRKRNTRQ